MFSLRFEPPDPARFPAIRLAYAVARAGGTAGAVFNAANEAAVAAFLGGAISFGEISRLVELTIDAHVNRVTPTLDDLIAADAWARAAVEAGIGRRGVRPVVAERV